MIVIEGDLDRARLRAAAEAVVTRHEALRTCLIRWPGFKSPVQVVREPSPVSWQEIDGNGETSSRELLREKCGEPIDLEKGPLVRFTLVSEGPRRHLFQMVSPALAADTVSLGNIFIEVVEAYDAGSGCGPGADEVVQFLQVSEWLNELAEDAESAARGREFWRQTLDGTAAARLPYEWRGDEAAEFRPEVRSFVVEPPLVAALGRAASKVDGGVEIFLLAAWTTLLWRLTGEADLVVEKVFDGRTMEELSSVCGLIARTLPLRIHLEKDFRFDETVVRLAAQHASAAEWQAFFARQVGREELLSAPEETFAFELVECPATVRAAGASFTLCEAHAGIDRFKAKLVCSRRGDALTVDLHHDPARLDPAAAECLLGQFRQLLSDASAEPATPLAELRLDDPLVRRRRLADLHRDGGGFELRAVCVHELFEHQATARPDDIAVVCEDRRLTYRGLDAQAEHFAQLLRRGCVGREMPVALLFERSVEMVVGLLAVLKAGAVYVPLDPTYPSRRLALMLEEVGAVALLTQRALLDRVPPGMHRILVLDDDGERERAREVKGKSLAAGAKTAPTQLAYVLFTSGSTGRPKGVAVEHRQLVSYVLAVAERMDLSPESSFATVSTFAADLGNTAVFSALCRGGCLHVIGERRVADAEAFGEYLASREVEALKIVPSHMAALLEGACPEHCLPRRLLVLGGEAASWDLIDRVRELAPACAVMNHYGPTETTVGVLGTVLRAEPAGRGARPPLGRPFANSTVYLLDRAMELVPVGPPGEIHIGGAGLARGYFGQPRETARHFLPDPFATAAGARLYRSGDLARYLPDGSLEFIGRADHQVKIRGYRVELSEIAMLLRQHPAVSAAAVLLREDDPGNRRLVAYVVVKRGREGSVGKVRDHLRERLPEHMVPVSFIELAALPLTANGKLDRAALPAPDETGGERRFEPPVSPTEELIAGLWTELLGVAQVGRSDHFFGLGGHSLSATQLVSRLRETFQVDVPLRQLFETPTVAGLAASIGAALRSGRVVELPPIEQVARRHGEGLPVSFGQRRLWLSQELDPRSSAYNIPSSIRVAGPFHVALLEDSLSEMVRRHEILRTTFGQRDGEPCQFVGAPFQVAVPVIDLRSIPAETRDTETKRFGAVSARAPFDLATGPLFRLRVVRLDDQCHAVLFAVHHIISDAWSAALFVRELMSFYDGLCAGKPSRLPELPVQYADFALWQRQWLRPEVLIEEVDFWRRQLAGDLPVLDFADRPRPPVMTNRGASLSARLPNEFVEKIGALGRRQGATRFMTFLAAFDVLLSYLGGTEDVIVGTNVLGRNRTETEGLIGFFLNMVVLRTQLSRDLTFLQLLERVRAIAIQAFAHQDLAFDQLVEVLKLKRDPSRHPLFQIKIDYQRLSRRATLPEGLALEEMELDFGTSHCDLTLYVKDLEDRVFFSLEYNADLFEETTVLRMSRYFEIVLRRVVADPEIGLAELFEALADEQERDRRTNEEDFRENRLQELRAAVRRRPGATASSMEVGS